MLTDVALCGEVRARTLLAPLPNGLATQLFAYLVLHRHRPVRHAALVDALWATARPRDPRAVVSSLLSRLRRSVGADALPVGAAVRLVLPADATVDVDVATAALAAARAALDHGDAADAWEHAGRARDIAGRGLLADFDARWIDPWRTDVEATHLDALELFARAGAELGGERARQGERAARQAIVRAPLRESAHAALMETLAALDEGAAALRVYEQLRRRLDTELGAIPSPTVRDLHQRLLQGEDLPPPGPPTGAPPASGAPAGPAHTSGPPAGDAFAAAPATAGPDSAAAPPPGSGPAAGAAFVAAPLPASGRATGVAPAGAALADRLDALGPRATTLVQRAAALGEVAAIELLVRLDEGDRADALAQLQLAFDDGLVAPVSSWLGPAVKFPYEPDADAVLAGLPVTARAQIAADATALLEQIDGDRVAIARLALRAVPALGRDEAVRRAREGVALLLRGRAFAPAAELAERALEIGPARSDRVALLLDLGRALRHDDPDRAWRAAASAYEAARELDDPVLVARAALATGGTAGAGRATHSDGGLARRLREALARLPAAAAPPAAPPAAAPSAAPPAAAPPAAALAAAPPAAAPAPAAAPSAAPPAAAPPAAAPPAAAAPAAPPPAAAPALAAAAPAADQLRAQLLARLAIDRSWSDPREAEQLADEAARVADAVTAAAAVATATVADLPLRVHARVQLAQIDARREPERSDSRLERADALAARARAEGDRAVEVAALLQALPLLGEMGRATAARASVDRLQELAAALDDRRTLHIVGDVHAAAALLAGDDLRPDPPAPTHDRSLGPAHDRRIAPTHDRSPAPTHDRPVAPAPASASAPADRLRDRLGPDLDPGGHGWRRIRARLALGTVAAALGELDDLVRLQPSLDAPRTLAVLARLLAGDREEAQRRLARWRADELADLARAEGAQLHARAALAFVAARLGDRERAAVLHDLLAPFADRHAVAPCTIYLAPVSRALGELAGALGRPQEARERFRAAIAAAEAIGAPAVADAIRRELDVYAQPSRDRI